MNLNQALAEIAVTGIFEGMQRDSRSIIDALSEEPINELSKISLRALLLTSEEKYEEVILLLEPWCTNEKNLFDTPHGFFTLALWRTDRIAQAKDWCLRLLNECQDETTRNMAQEILHQTGE
ncbi:hypothetical protein TDB9533_04617 [Thalassocella blandensis]|nr:hypothetical protein TDB9533_04617 [Thalassocella blandensis]